MHGACAPHYPSLRQLSVVRFTLSTLKPLCSVAFRQTHYIKSRLLHPSPSPSPHCGETNKMSSSSPTPTSPRTLPHMSSTFQKSDPHPHSNRNTFRASSLPHTSAHSPSHQSHRDNSIPNIVNHLPVAPHHYDIPPGPITSPPPLPPDNVRLLNPPNNSPSLSSRISSLEDRVRNSPYLQEILGLMSRRAANIATGIDVDRKLHFPGNITYETSIVSYGFPKSDVDADYCLEDTPGLSDANFNLLKHTLSSHLQRCRRCAQEMVSDLESTLAAQIPFRVLPAAEMERRIQYIVNKFCDARQQILHKFRGYVRNRRWIENVATRQRRGCLSHRQNNILRLWLFSNFNNPYPDTKDKRKLITETSLNITQINNWLINARSRVWKPTVEIMSGERIRKEMRKKEDALANGKIRDWDLAEFSITLRADNRRGNRQGGRTDLMLAESVRSGAHTAAQSTSLGPGPIANGISCSSGGTVDGNSSVAHDVGTNVTQQVERLVDDAGNWLVPQTFGALEFNDVDNHHSG